MRIRQLALVARDLDPTLDALCAALDVEVCHRDPGVEAFGLHNGLMAIGDDFLEVVSPLREGTTAGRLLDRRKAEGAHPEGDGGYMVIFQSRDLASDRLRISKLGVRLVWEISFADMATIHLHPRDVGGAIVSLDWADPPASWRWAGPDWSAHRKTGTVTGIAGAALSAADPAAMAARWAAVIGLDASTAVGPAAKDGSVSLALPGGQCLRYLPAAEGQSEGLVGIDLRAAPGVEAREQTLCGVQVRLVPAG